MATNQGVSNERKKELAQMDSFQIYMAKILSWASAHKKPLCIGIGAVAGVVIIFSAIMFSFKQSEINASELVAAAYSKYETQYAKDRDAKKGFEAVKDDFQTVFDEYANTSAGRMALVTFGKICFDAEAYDKAFSMYSKALSSVGKKAEMENFILCSLGTISELKNDLEQAKSYYLRVEKSDSALLKDSARFALAQIYEKLNDMEASRNMYEEIALSQDSSMYKAIAQAKISDQ